ncbi:MAG: class I SAM-dependent methyltransferase [Candidatus Omnitrophica bacterium]|nr:class I SAM-dependent methyltransferase [Candidatus Omnitrophota bacterium]
MSLKEALKSFVTDTSLGQGLYRRYVTLTTLTEWYARDRLKQILSSLPSDGITNVLDAGAGFGQYVYLLGQRKGVKVTALELNGERVQSLEKGARLSGMELNTIQGRLEDLQDQEQYELAICLDVLEHIEQDAEALAALHRGLRSGGVLLLGVPACPQKRILPFMETLMDMEHDHGAEGHGHVREGYTLEGLSALLQQSGFHIEKTEYSYGWPGALAYEIFFALQHSPLVFLLGSWWYFACLHPWMMALMWADRMIPWNNGNGILVTARKESHEG